MSDATSVIGSKAVKVAEFQITADESSALEFTDATVHLSVATAADSVAATASAATPNDLLATADKK